MGFFIRMLTGFVCFVLSAGCSQFSSHEIFGDIDSDFVAALERVPDAATINVTSAGGDPDFAESAARIIQRKKLHVSVDKFCLSSCVEYVLVAAQSVKFTSAPIIGLHQNPSLINDLKNKDERFTGKPLCYFEDNLDYYEKLHLSTRSVAPSNEYVLERVKLTDTRIREKDDCVEVGFKFQNPMWLPTRKQLRDLWGLKFTGSVCADSYEACGLTIDRRWPEGARVVIGDVVYVSKGVAK